MAFYQDHEVEQIQARPYHPSIQSGSSNPAYSDDQDVIEVPSNEEYDGIPMTNMHPGSPKKSTGSQADFPPNSDYPYKTDSPPAIENGEEPKDNVVTKCMRDIGQALDSYYMEHRKVIHYIIYGILIALYFAYLIYACYYNFKKALALVVMTALVLLYILYVLLRDNFGEQVYDECIAPMVKLLDKYWYIIKWFVYLALLIALIVFLVIYGKDNPEQMISVVGLVFFVVFCFIFSKAPLQVKWRPVLWGLALQFLLGLFILRTKAGYDAFKWLGDQCQIFLEYTDAGSRFLFGDLYTNHFFAFKVLPVVIYFSCVISILYYWNVMQFLISKIAWIMQVTMKTSATESLNAAGNIFIGQTEAPLLIKPFLKDMTKSELHAVMTGGFATIAGSVLGAYIAFGISSSHLISASVMSAPAALAIAKLFYPEIEHSNYMSQEQVIKRMEKENQRNVIEAASSGASTAVSLVGNIAANLIAFIALLEFLNAVLSWLGGMVGYEELSFELICSYVFMPIAWLMGTPWEDCHLVAELIGIKTFINEFVAYARLAEILENRGIPGSKTISKRGEVIATYALCGFANIGSVGIQLGGITPMCPQRKGDLAEVAIRALIAGTVACFMTACIAGVLYEDFDSPIPTVAVNSTVASLLNVTTV
ncbi:solute carrier family 28 member 3-like isoform X2 [Ptychodera flava]|uniref:solute carrier family 28 member 3-like isoform X2 n=1 Tax=Ptychodera flava TaxID=63121 RepID=UPI003969E5DC